MQGTLGSPVGQITHLPLPSSPPAVDMGDRTGGADLGIWERGMAAGTAAFISTLVVNPLELVKTRMQIQACSPASTSAPTAALRYAEVGFNGTSGCLALRHPHHLAPAHEAISQAPPAYRSALQGLLRIARHEGLAVLWRGTDVSLMVAVPMVMLYFPLYESLLKRCQQSAEFAAAPLVAGAAARTAVVFAISPLELIRVRMQGQGPPAKPLPYGQHLLQVVRKLQQEGQGRGLARYGHYWRGVGATLAKDVPFAAGYWMLFEPLRKLLLSQQHDKALGASQQCGATDGQVYLSNAAAGFCAASIAACITTPLDVVKTHAQMGGASHRGMVQTAAAVMRANGVRSLFAGAGPRSVRAGCAYAILMSSYEAFKSMELRSHRPSAS